MKIIEFAKLVASGNDFILIKNKNLNFKKLAKKICDRKFGIGADGLLVLSKSKTADLDFRIFNSDGSEAEMCGNGIRCASLYKYKELKKDLFKIKTKAGLIYTKVKNNNVKIRFTKISDIKLNIPLKIDNINLNVNFINTGVPHVVIFTEDLDNLDVYNLGRKIRFHEFFSPSGTNVNFVKVLKEGFIKIRTYERGVEDETLSCGTGTVASSIIYKLLFNTPKNKIRVLSKSGEILNVYLKKDSDKIEDVWFEGRAKIICKGVFYV